MLGQKHLGMCVRGLGRGQVVSGTGRRVHRAGASWKEICKLNTYFVLVWVSPRGEGRRPVVSELRVGVDAR